MPNGSLSTFPTTVDQFAVKVPGMTEEANHINHYNDAIIRVEQYLINKLGGGVLSSNASGLIYGPDLIVGTATFSTTTSSLTNTLTVSGTVPAAFGSNPFSDLGFIAVPTVYITQAGQATGGIWANQNWSDPQPLNEMLTWTQYYTMLKPLTGSNFEIDIISKVYTTPAFSGSGVFTDSFARGDNTSLGVNWNEYENSSSSTLSVQTSSFRFSNTSTQYGLAYPKLFDSILSSFRNQELIVELDSCRMRATRSSGYLNRGGPVVRASKALGSDGKYYLDSGYMLSFADHNTASSDSMYTSIRLLKLPLGGDGKDLSAYTELASASSFSSTTRLGSSVYYSLSAVDAGGGGVSVVVKEKLGGGSWTTKLSYTDSSTPLLSGFAGFSHGYTTGTASIGTTFEYKNLTIQQPVASGSVMTLAQADVRVLYVRIQDSLRTMGNNW